MKEAKYKKGDTITGYNNITGTIEDMVYNPEIKEWLYYTYNITMVIKESNIKNGK